LKVEGKKEETYCHLQVERKKEVKIDKHLQIVVRDKFRFKRIEISNKNKDSTK